MSARGGWLLAACLAAGCAHGGATAPTSPALVASIAPFGRPTTTESGRYGLVVVMSACWYRAAPAASANDAAPRPDPRQCRTVGERVVADLPDAASHQRVERLTIEDVALKLERPLDDDSAN